ncbi:sensor histidine kinase [Saliterribacillus persicus]|uniref:Two-component system sensor histidine kinase YesM n=1 Tax=Saliterribacillus persicus TaxID=930114 RepID=A0A368XZ11_9BACI|nr:sensor histidine kinase [Saliterribacillus persicus]RCW73223.1 two-component system sensor histidine kinase YesM [Saliterribacillus persicus]
MKKLIRFVQANNLFIKFFLVMVISIIAVSLFITYSSIRMSSNLFIDTFSITNSKVMDQITQRFNSFTDSIVSASLEVDTNGTIKQLLLEDHDNAVDKSTFYFYMTDEMDRIYSEVDPDDTNMVIMSNSNDIFNMNYIKWQINGHTLMNDPMIERVENSPNEIVYQYEDSELTNGVPMIIASKALKLKTGYIYGYLFFSLTEPDLKEFYESYTGVGNNVLLVTPTGKIISSNQDERIGETSPQLLSYAEDFENLDAEYQQVNVFDQDYIFLSEYIPSLDIYLINLIDQETVAENVTDTNEIILISIAIVSLSVLVAFLILRRMTNSISNLVHQISDMARYQFNKPLKVTGGYETRKIANAFNYMLNELQDYVQILMKTQEKQRKAELEALQHQISPHFIYNTLASIKFMIKQEKKETASDTIDSFISLLQSSISNADETITVEQELENLKSYVQINQARYGERIKVNYLVSPDCLDLYLPKLVIQPFIENAFFHAFTKKKSGYIQILIAQKEEKLVCEIIDNGDGMISERIANNTIKSKEKRQLFSGIGVKNVHERIQLRYGKNYGVEITSELSKGTRVIIKLPVNDEQT